MQPHVASGSLPSAPVSRIDHEPGRRDLRARTPMVRLALGLIGSSRRLPGGRGDSAAEPSCQTLQRKAAESIAGVIVALDGKVASTVDQFGGGNAETCGEARHA